MTHSFFSSLILANRSYFLVEHCRVKSCVGSGAHTTLSITVENGKWDASQVSNYLQRRTPSAIVNTVVSLGLGLMQRRTPSVMVNTVIRPRPNLPIPCKLKPLRVYI
ncbi:uncharacterized protein LOC143038040 isoform X2 [Oratosquilla oratoria]|uniref:uncharacterized protein LOC143038040 isoform X2 n=1 Tax=Oratosquilla oratoria TaxID=337810 RepID=UPI003F768BE2